MKLISLQEGKLDHEGELYKLSLTFHREPNVLKEVLAFSVACTQIAFPVYAAALFRENFG